MKKIFTFLAAVLLTANVFAQTPEKMSYQAIVRNADDELVTNANVNMKISILQGSEEGTAVYVETQTAQTDQNGLISIQIGGDNASIVSGDFSAIDWGSDAFYVKTETDPTGGTDYSITGTSQLLSVPYALHAKTVESSSTGGSNDETHAVGDEWGGGIVFYVTEDGKHGLIAAKQDQVAAADTPEEWIAFPSYYKHTMIVNNPYYHDAEGKKYLDWRLPYLWELNIMYDLKDVIGGFVTEPSTNPDEPAPGAFYMSGTEYYYSLVWAQDFATGDLWKDPSKTTVLNMRAVRTF